MQVNQYTTNMERLSFNTGSEDDDKVFTRSGPITLKSMGYSWHQMIKYQFYWSIHFDDMWPLVILN